jgi:hypothetical protein
MVSRETYVSLSLAALKFGPRRLDRIAHSIQIGDSRPIRTGLKTARFSDSGIRLPCPKTPCRDPPQLAQNQIKRIIL